MGTTPRSTANDLRPRGQRGFTLVEVLLAVTIGALIVGTVAGALILVMRSSHSSEAGLDASNNVFRAGARFADDVSSVAPAGGATEHIAAGVPGCGGSTAVLRLVGPGDPDAVLVRSYHQVATGSVDELVRRECGGATLGAALAASPTTTVLISDLDTVAATCDGGAVSAACRVVEMTVRQSSGRELTARGTVSSALEPTPTTTPAPVRAPASGQCTLPVTVTAWGATGGVAGDRNANHNGDPVMYTYDDTNQRYSFLRVDLTQPCMDAADSWTTLPGQRNLTGASLRIAYLGDNGASCWIFGGISGTGQRLVPLNDAATWAPSTLTGANMPGGLRSGNDTNFNESNPNTLSTISGTGIFNAVQAWYTPGSWVNNGWRLARSGAGDTCGRSDQFATQNHANAALRPRVVVTWGP